MTLKKKNRKASDLLKEDLLADFPQDVSGHTNSQSLKLVDEDDSQSVSNSVLVEDTIAGFWNKAKADVGKENKHRPKNEVEQLEEAIGHSLDSEDSQRNALLEGSPQGMDELNVSGEDDSGEMKLPSSQSKVSVISFNESLEKGREKKRRTFGAKPAPVVENPVEEVPVVEDVLEAPAVALEAEQSHQISRSEEKEVLYSEVAETRVAGSEVAETRVGASSIAETKVGPSSIAETRVGPSSLAETRVGHSEMAETRVAGSEVAETRVAGSESADADFLNDYGKNKDIGQELDLANIPDVDLVPDRIREVNFDAPDAKVVVAKKTGGYNGPSADGGYQSIDDILNPKPVAAAVIEAEEPIVVAAAPAPVVEKPAKPDVFLSAVTAALSSVPDADDKTLPLASMLSASNPPKEGNTRTDHERTLAVPGFSNRNRAQKNDADIKVAIGNFINSRPGSANVFTSADASLAQSEALRIAQARIAELEKEVDLLRLESHEIASSAELVSQKNEDQKQVLDRIERDHSEVRGNLEQEVAILRDNLDKKSHELNRAYQKIDELEQKLKSDFRKIRVRERELENRLELLRAEKSSIVRSKDEYILEQKRKTDQIALELGNYREKVVELNKLINENQEQFRRTEKALRLALTNLEAKTDSPLKKAN